MGATVALEAWTQRTVLKAKWCPCAAGEGHYRDEKGRQQSGEPPLKAPWCACAAQGAHQNTEIQSSEVPEIALLDIPSSSHRDLTLRSRSARVRKAAFDDSAGFLVASPLGASPAF